MGWGMGMGETAKSNTGVVAHQLLLGVVTFAILKIRRTCISIVIYWRHSRKTTKSKKASAIYV